jgi:hypothetical protein
MGRAGGKPIAINVDRPLQVPNRVSPSGVETLFDPGKFTQSITASRATSNPVSAKSAGS